MRSIYLILFTLTVFSCNQKQNNSFKNILNEDQLASQFFNVNVHRDTTLITHDGCIIKIPKESIESDSNNVKLDIKEALTASEIVLAGLTTQSNNYALSSGGMIYFNAATGYNISIKKSLEILVPTDAYNRNMKVYKGQKNQDGKINWKDPQPLPEDSITKKIDPGERLFKSNCASCHKIYEDLTGPALYAASEKYSQRWLRTFTRHIFSIGLNPDSLYTADTSRSKIYDIFVDQDILNHHECLKQQFGSEMIPFPSLSDADIENLYAYIKTESDSRPDLKSKFSQTCCDSCNE